MKQAEKIQKIVDSGNYDLNMFEFIESDGTGEYSLRFPRSKVPFTVKEKAALKSAFADFLKREEAEPADHFLDEKDFDKNDYFTFHQLSPVEIKAEEDSGVSSLSLFVLRCVFFFLMGLFVFFE